MEHPCIDCVNNWSNEPLPCSDVCHAVQDWKEQDEATEVTETEHEIQIG